MDYLIRIVVLSLCAACVRAYQPFGVVVQSRGGRPLLQDLMDEYEPYAIAALPMPSPMPLFQLVSPPAPRKYKSHKPARQPERQPEREYVYAASSHEQSYETPEYSESTTKPKYSIVEEEDAPVYVYARPNKYGGFSYRKPAPAPPAPPAATHREPFVVRIHRYRISRDR